MVNFGILGCGKIGNRHAEKMKDQRNIRLSAVCDIIPARAKELAKINSCKYYTNIIELLQDPDIDFVNICTPSGLHANHTIQCLNAKKNVLCEKPMALTENDALKMVQAAKKNKKLLYVVKQNRYNPPVKLVEKLQKSGKLGKPIMCVVNMFWNRHNEYYKSDPWRGTLALDGGTIFTQASHFVDLMLMFMGNPKSVYSLMGTKNHNIEIEDTGTITTEFKNGSYGIVNYTTCATNKNFEGSITLIFTNGTIKIGGEYINTIDYFQVKGVKKYSLKKTDASANDYGTYRGSMSNHDQVFKDILKRVSNKNYNGDLVFGNEAINTIRFIEKAFKSAQTGKVIKL